MVRLKLDHQKRISGHMPSFNSKMVRLKQAGRMFGILICSWFQFQNGTIKAPMLSDIVNGKNEFQFQNGTIKAK